MGSHLGPVKRAGSGEAHRNCGLAQNSNEQPPPWCAADLASPAQPGESALSADADMEDTAMHDENNAHVATAAAEPPAGGSSPLAAARPSAICQAAFVLCLVVLPENSSNLDSIFIHCCNEVTIFMPL